MKQFLSVILAVVLVLAVGGSVASGTMAGFFDAEVSTDNLMCAGTVNLELGSGPLQVDAATPSKWYSKEHVLINAGTLDATASVHIQNLVCTEDALGAGVATAEPELVAEEGGWLGQVLLPGLGVDTGGDTGAPDLVIAKFIDVKLWFDKDGSCSFEDDELVEEDKLSELACTEYILGVIPGSPKVKAQGGGWGSYFEYTIGDPTLELPLMMGQNLPVGTVTVWNDQTYLYVEYDTTDNDNGWEMAVTHVYVGTDPPDKLAPGSFPYKHDPVSDPYTDLYEIPLAWSAGDLVYIAAHAEGTDGETAWGKGVFRKFKIEVHFPDIDEDDLIAAGLLADPGTGYGYFDDSDPDVQEKCWDHWPTNAYMGDKATFDLLFLLNGDNPKGKK